MNGHQPKKPTQTKPPTIKPVDNIPALTEQLNGLIDRYNDIYGLYSKLQYMPKNESAERLKRVLDNIEKAIEAICLRLTQTQVIVNTESNTTQHF